MNLNLLRFGGYFIRMCEVFLFSVCQSISCRVPDSAAFNVFNKSVALKSLAKERQRCNLFHWQWRLPSLWLWRWIECDWARPKPSATSSFPMTHWHGIVRKESSKRRHLFQCRRLGCRLPSPTAVSCSSSFFFPLAFILLFFVD